MKRHGAFFLLFLCCVAALGQREASIWYFGDNAGLDFNSGTPLPLLDGQIATLEGCSSMADNQGNLLFYSDGSTVWNKTHTIMTNGEGLRGSFSSSQAAMIVPVPQNKNLYYIFTPDDVITIRETGIPLGFNYAIVDMSLQNGLGAVTTKNVQLLERCGEQVAAVRNTEGDFYWIVTQYEDKIYSYKLTENGLDPNPVISNNPYPTDNFNNLRGSLKFSPNGSNLASAGVQVFPNYGGKLVLYDFDMGTGMVQNASLLSDDNVYYGVEFSADGAFLYTSGVELMGSGSSSSLGDLFVSQYNLNSEIIDESEFTLGLFPNPNQDFLGGSLQIAIDKKIYHALPAFQLSVINKPSEIGLEADFNKYAVDLGGRRATYGLPPFIQSYFLTQVEIQNFCEGSLTTFKVLDTTNITGIVWDFGDVNSGDSNFSSEINPSHVFSSEGDYTVNFTVTYLDGSSQDYFEFVSIFSLPEVPEEVTLLQCDIDGLGDGLSVFDLNTAISIMTNGNLDLGANFFLSQEDARLNHNSIVELIFYNTEPNQQLFANVFYNSQCYTTVKVNLKVPEENSFLTYEPMVICNSLNNLTPKVDVNEVLTLLEEDFTDFGTITLYKSAYDALLEQNEVSNNELHFDTYDDNYVFFRIETQELCDYIGEIPITFVFPPTYEPLSVQNLCGGNAFIEGISGYDIYQWADGYQGRSRIIQQAGSYTLTFGSGLCFYEQNFEVLPEIPLKVRDITVEDFKPNNTLTIVMDNPEGRSFEFSINGGLTYQGSGFFENLNPGVYSIVVTNGCQQTQEIVAVGGMPNFFSPNGDGANEVIQLQNAVYFKGYQLKIFDRYGRVLKVLNENNPIWEGLDNDIKLPATDYWYLLELQDGRQVKGHFSLKR